MEYRGRDVRVIAYDLVRLFVGPLFLTPRGIDRVDLAMARQVFADPDSPNLGILPTPWGVRAYPAAVVRVLLAQLEELWVERLTEEQDPQLRYLIERLTTSSPGHCEVRPPNRLTLLAKLRRILKLLWATGLPPGSAAKRAVPPGCVYINIGQLGLAIPIFHRWLERRGDILTAMMLHDVIPLDYPEFVSAAAAAHHERMVLTAARHADCLIFNSAYARDGVTVALSRHGRNGLPSLVRSLPLPAAYAEAMESPPRLADTNYFLVVSTIEPRKNHAMLFRVWRRLAARLGESAPHLVVVGALGRDAARILSMLDDEPSLRSRIHVVAGLSSRALASLTLGATGVLCPSLVEGFGLPLLEANSMGVPTIASDIPAHREVANATTVLLPADDDAGWESAIAVLEPVRQRIRPDIAPSLTEAAYCAALVTFIESVCKPAPMPAPSRHEALQGS
jgi:glycosyltransferase involved in cell wall biosynthesis